MEPAMDWAIDEPPGIVRPKARDELITKEGLAYDEVLSITVARPLRSFTGFFVSSSTTIWSVCVRGEGVKVGWRGNGSLNRVKLGTILSYNAAYFHLSSVDECAAQGCVSAG
jgi:hypothetical protein